MEQDTKKEEDEIFENECKCCHLKASNILGLINHIEETEKCYKIYNVTGIELLKEAAQNIINGEYEDQIKPPKDIIVQYQTDDNKSCNPIIEDGTSKLDLSKPREIRTLPRNHFLISRLFPSNFSDVVESVVGMCLSSDGECIEVRTIMTRNGLHDLYSLMNVFHAVMAVCDSDLCTLTHFKHSPFNLNDTGANIVVLRNRYSTDLIDSEGKMPEPPETTCIPDRTRYVLMLF